VTIYLETPTRHRADRGLRSPPSTRVKKLERSLKSNEAEPTIFLVLTQILEAVPPFKRTPEHIFSGTIRVQKGP
jgi:hypothetical protein